MTQPKFPWALLVIIAMFTFVAVTAQALWILVFAVIAVIVSAAAAVYQIIPREDPLTKPPADPDEVPDQWGGDSRP